ncbi:hypothetical protein [Pseudoclavibacter terrae]|uniref:hypothetical protein n=1 Tax=Pseudoclavibacter terrae TaxID=1530195 RepID=UPI0023315A80|nr:hypothetical protein [Pseudoclavibacter terrae]
MSEVHVLVRLVGGERQAQCSWRCGAQPRRVEPGRFALQQRGDGIKLSDACLFGTPIFEGNSIDAPTRRNVSVLVTPTTTAVTDASTGG